jgi:hypothetical protein
LTIAIPRAVAAASPARAATAACDKKRRSKVDVLSERPILLLDLRGRSERIDAGCGNDDIRGRAKRGDGATHRVARVGDRCKVHLDAREDGRTRQSGQGLRIPIERRDYRTFLQESRDDGPADASRGAGHDGAPSREPAHRASPSRS